MREMQIIYKIKRYKSQIMGQLHFSLLKYYKGKDALVMADYDANTITITINDQKLADTDLKDIFSCFGISKRIISAFVDTKIFIDGKEVIKYVRR